MQKKRFNVLNGGVNLTDNVWPQGSWMLLKTSSQPYENGIH